MMREGPITPCRYYWTASAPMRLLERCVMRCGRFLASTRSRHSRELNYPAFCLTRVLFVENVPNPRQLAKEYIAMKRIRQLLAFSLMSLIVSTAGAQQTKKIKVDFKDVKLKNGLRVLLVEDHSAPVVSVAITYDVGSRNERKGRTGFAHLFEHMMFTGSQNVGKNEYSLLIDTNGGGNNATTSEDRTLYFATVPSNQLDMILFLEADRMRNLHVTQHTLDTQRNAVQEERRRGLDNQPYGKTGEKYQETIYDNFAYKHSVIGSMDDLNRSEE